MALSVDDEDQVEALKQWWRENRVALIGGLTIGVGAIGGWEGWNSWRDGRAMAASQMYQELTQAQDSGKSQVVEEIADKLASDYSASPYASGARLRQAQMAANQHRYDEAIGHLQWVIDNSKDRGLRQLAGLRMARLLHAQEKSDQALVLLDQNPGHFLPLYLELRGDILLATGARESARTAYAEALAETGMQAANRSLLEYKLADLAEGTNS